MKCGEFGNLPIALGRRYDDGWNIMHPGFPAGINLRCPVFNGDKYTYLNAAKGCTIPSLKIPLSLDMDDGAIGVVLESVNRYIILCIILFVYKSQLTYWRYL